MLNPDFKTHLKTFKINAKNDTFLSTSIQSILLLSILTLLVFQKPYELDSDSRSKLEYLEIIHIIINISLIILTIIQLIQKQNHKAHQAPQQRQTQYQFLDQSSTNQEKNENNANENQSNSSYLTQDFLTLVSNLQIIIFFQLILYNQMKKHEQNSVFIAYFTGILPIIANTIYSFHYSNIIKYLNFLPWLTQFLIQLFYIFTEDFFPQQNSYQIFIFITTLSLFQILLFSTLHTKSQQILSIFSQINAKNQQISLLKQLLHDKNNEFSNQGLAIIDRHLNINFFNQKISEILQSNAKTDTINNFNSNNNNSLKLSFKDVFQQQKSSQIQNYQDTLYPANIPSLIANPSFFQLNQQQNQVKHQGLNLYQKLEKWLQNSQNLPQKSLKIQEKFIAFHHNQQLEISIYKSYQFSENTLNPILVITCKPIEQKLNILQDLQENLLKSVDDFIEVIFSEEDEQTIQYISELYIHDIHQKSLEIKEIVQQYAQKHPNSPQKDTSLSNNHKLTLSKTDNSKTSIHTQIDLSHLINLRQEIRIIKQLVYSKSQYQNANIIYEICDSLPQYLQNNLLYFQQLLKKLVFLSLNLSENIFIRIEKLQNASPLTRNLDILEISIIIENIEQKDPKENLYNSLLQNQKSFDLSLYNEYAYTLSNNIQGIEIQRYEQYGVQFGFLLIDTQKQRQEQLKENEYMQKTLNQSDSNLLQINGNSKNQNKITIITNPQEPEHLSFQKVKKQSTLDQQDIDNLPQITLQDEQSEAPIILQTKTSPHQRNNNNNNQSLMIMNNNNNNNNLVSKMGNGYSNLFKSQYKKLDSQYGFPSMTYSFLSQSNNNNQIVQQQVFRQKNKKRQQNTFRNGGGLASLNMQNGLEQYQQSQYDPQNF